jgi:hypothetical protein
MACPICMSCVPSARGMNGSLQGDRLAELDGPFSVDTAVNRGLLAECDQPLEALSGLYEKSLLSVHSRDDPPTFRVMDTIRAFVTARPQI